jgi:hypothetical protein
MMKKQEKANACVSIVVFVNALTMMSSSSSQVEATRGVFELEES